MGKAYAGCGVECANAQTRKRVNAKWRKGAKYAQISKKCVNRVPCMECAQCEKRRDVQTAQNVRENVQTAQNVRENVQNARYTKCSKR